MVRNPFITKGYVSSRYFCDRKEETEKIVSAIINGRDLLLLSPRRIGKTGLIHHVLNQKQIKKSYNIFFCDIYQTTNLADMTTLIGNVVLNRLGKTTGGVLHKVKDFFSGFSPSISFNPITLEAEIDFNFKNASQAQNSLEQIFKMLKESKKPSVLVFDEFQQIEKFPEKNVEAILRTQIQHLNNVHMIYSGSSKHILTSMFSDASRPFYQSTQFMVLDKIEKKAYGRFIQSRFRSSNISIDKNAIEYLLQVTRRHTYYVQYLCNRLFDMQVDVITEEIVNEKLSTILLENENYYYGFRNLLTKQQYSILKAIAKEEGVKQPSAQSFIRKYNLGTTSTINSAIKSLIKKDLIFMENEKYQVYDVFFSLWFKLYS